MTQKTKLPLLFLAAALAWIASPVLAADENSLERAARLQVEALLDEQSAAWNRGDLEAFCSVYAADASFIAPSGLTTGRDAVLERYKKKYPDAASRGTLTLEILEMRFARGPEAARRKKAIPAPVRGVSLVARWSLAYEGKGSDGGQGSGEAKAPAKGLTLLVLSPRAEGWEIVQDASM